MGVAAYNRGSQAIRSQIEQEYGKVLRYRTVPEILTPITNFEHNQPQKPALGYWNLCQDPKLVEVGDRVFCTVSACRGWYTVTAIKGNRSDLRIKTDGDRNWGYAHNFTRNPVDWMLR